MYCNYDQLINLFVPKEKIIEYSVNYFGEDKRRLIESKINTMGINFVAKDLSTLEIRLACKKIYKNKLGVNWLEEANKCIKNLKALSSNSKLFSIETLASHSMVLRELGFDVNNILIKNSRSDKFKLINSEETKKLKNYVVYSVNKADVVKDVIDVNSLIKAYNEASQAKCFTGFNTTIDDQTKKLNLSLEFELNNIIRYNNLDCDFPKIIPLNKKGQDFLLEFLQAEGPVSAWDDKYANYMLSGINKIFKRKYNSINDVLKDKTMKIFLDVMNRAAIALKNHITTINTDKSFFMPMQDEKEYIRIAQNFTSGSASAFYQADSHEINIPLNVNSSIEVVLHEVNHAYSKYISLSQSKMPVNHPLYEIITEFITRRTLQNIPKEEIYNDGVFDAKNSIYVGGISLMEKFLIKFEKVIKKAQLEGYEKVFTNYFGKENFKKLLSYASFIKQNNWGVMSIPLMIKDRKTTTNLKEWLSIYKKTDKIINHTEEKYLNKLYAFDEMDNFLDDLISHYADFEKGIIVDNNVEADNLL